MTAHVSTASPTIAEAHSAEISKRYEEGIVAGLIGAAVVAIWFLIVDQIHGRPLYTPTVLGTALFGSSEALKHPESIAPSFEMALMFTWVHALVFAIIGGVAARLLGLAERDPNYGFGIILLFVIFMFGFLIGAMTFAEDVLRAVAWPAVLAGNLLASAAMAGYFWRRHPDIAIWP